MNVVEKVQNMSNTNLQIVWNALCTQRWGSSDMHSAGISMDDWANLIYSEMNHRGLSTLPTRGDLNSD